MTRQQILERIRDVLANLNGQASAAEFRESDSLVQDLGMDSFGLESLMSTVREEILDVEFTPWFIRASRHGEDTLGSFVDFVVQQQHGHGGQHLAA